MIHLKVLEFVESPVLQKGDNSMEDNKYGFERGTAYRLDGKVHLFTAEVYGEPKVVLFFFRDSYNFNRGK
ncbi:MAG: hypothetical protein ACLFUC_03240 [Bacteroidales bacterium]